MILDGLKAKWRYFIIFLGGLITIALTNKQRIFLNAMLTSESVTEATRKAGITKNTAYRYLNDAEWKAEYRKQTSAITAELTNQILQLGTKAIKTLEENLTDEEATPASRNTTAKTILDYIYQSYERNEIIERIEALEQLFKDDE